MANQFLRQIILGKSFSAIFAFLIVIFKIKALALAGVAQLVGASPHKPKGHVFDSRSGYMSRLRVQSLVRTQTRGNRWMFLSHIDVLHLHSLLPPQNSVSLSSGENKNIRDLQQIFSSCLYEMVEQISSRFTQTRIWIPSLPLLSYMIAGEVCNHSGLWFIPSSWK